MDQSLQSISCLRLLAGTIVLFSSLAAWAETGTGSKKDPVPERAERTEEDAGGSRVYLHFRIKSGYPQSLCLAVIRKPLSPGEHRVLPDTCASDNNSRFWLATAVDDVFQLKSLMTPNDDFGLPSLWCLTRRTEDALDQLTLTECLAGKNDSQLWAFDQQGALLRVKDGQPSTEPVRVLDQYKSTFGGFKGDFSWIREPVPRKNWCYVLPWRDDCRVCSHLPGTEAGQCPAPAPVPQQDPQAPKPEPQPDAEPEKHSDKQPEKQSEKQSEKQPDNKPSTQGSPVTSTNKLAAHFVLRQVRTDQNICLGLTRVEQKDRFGGVEQAQRVSLQYCNGSQQQEWSHDLGSKAVYNRSLGKELCLSRTKRMIVMAPCLQPGQSNNAQKWYFSRGWLRGVPYAALVSFTEENENWTGDLLNDSRVGSYSIRPSYTQCEQIEGRCYDLVSGKLMQKVPRY